MTSLSLRGRVLQTTMMRTNQARTRMTRKRIPSLDWRRSLAKRERRT